MTDGAARALHAARNDTLIARAVPHLTSRNPSEFWTSGQWMTEAAGGSDVGQTETVARHDGSVWRLHGKKWFVSAVQSQVALTLARPEGNPPGSKGLALFYVETRDGDRLADGIRIDRLKDKLGTRKVPTAELTLDGVKAELLADTRDGVKHIAPMLNVTRAWNTVSAAAFMRRGLALARDYARHRVAFGAPLADQPLHVDTLAGLQAEFEGVFHFAMFIAELLGRIEHERASEAQQRVHRVLTPIAKLLTGRQVIEVMSEVIEAFGGAGYVEDTGLPALLRDAHVLPIWEGTTNVLALDALHAVADEETRMAVRREAALLLNSVHSRHLLALSARVEGALDQAEAWRLQAITSGSATLEAGARRYAMTLGRSFELALLLRHAQRGLDEQGDKRSCAAAVRFAASGINLLHHADLADSRALGRDAE
jgi:alkylation response protein AidB-like acyl-CoA dehydrogenase